MLLRYLRVNGSVNCALMALLLSSEKFCFGGLLRGGAPSLPGTRERREAQPLGPGEEGGGEHGGEKCEAKEYKGGRVGGMRERNIRVGR